MEQPEKIEGIDNDEIDGWGEYPLDSVFVRTQPRNVKDVVARIKNDRYIMAPDFQRSFLWPVKKQSKLIESCIMRIPLPVFYVAEAPDGRIIVVDGLQRLTTFVRFLGNQFRLTGLAGEDSNNDDHPLEGKLFKDLPINLRERIEDTALTMYILDSKAPERARLDIFERVNSGEPLTRQQMRNAIYSGASTEWLAHASNSDAFRRATASSLNARTMRDREAINRFCAFSIFGWRNYKSKDMDRFLADTLLEMNKASNESLSKLYHQFEIAMDRNHSLFRRHAFRKSLSNDSFHSDRSVINIALFEVLAVTFSFYSKDEMPSRKKVVELVQLPRFDRAITYSTNSTQAVRDRFRIAEEHLELDLSGVPL